MKNYSHFEFVSRSFDSKTKEAVFSYRLYGESSSLSFTEKVIFPESACDAHVPDGLREKIFDSLHIILGLSYYKLYCPPSFVCPYSFTQEEAFFWNTVYEKGLGEFLYKNNISHDSLAKFVATSSGQQIDSFTFNKLLKQESLVGIGGGKDSIVAGELLKKIRPIKALLIETNTLSPIAEQVVNTMGVSSVVVRRFLDPQIFENHSNSYNGHIPISAIFAFLGYATAVFCEYDSVVVGNEYSSNFGNILYEQKEINHQWSKSLEFEKLFQEYTRKFFTSEVKYFSLMRPYYEVRIAQMFTEFTQYFPIFSSCNRSFTVHKEPGKTNWCGECAKCVFVFVLFSAFLEKEVLVNIFGKNLYEVPTLNNLLKDVLGVGNLKPFDCVGVFEEAQYAARLAAERSFADQKELLDLVAILPTLSDEHFLSFQDTETLPAWAKLLVAEKVAIAGFGKEGKATKEFLEKFYPTKEVVILHTDQELSKDISKNYDLVIKTPGIAKSKLHAPYTTATNLFFSLVPRHQIIGITGTKGKSTTAALVAHLLKSKYSDVRLVGNIGTPMLEEYVKGFSKDTLFVVELSSYQLDDISASPKYALVTNLYNDHALYHGTTEAYHQAKKNITLFQQRGDFLFLSPKQKELAGWRNSTLATVVAYDEAFYPQTALIGDHNQENIQGAATVAAQFGINPKEVQSLLRSFEALPHRLEYIGTHKEISFYDDAISTTPESTLEALKSLPATETILLGGEDRGYDFSELERFLIASRVKNIVLFPKTGERMNFSEERFRLLRTDSLEEAVLFCYEYTTAGKICLLSTASPSYSIWKNFEEKGDLFKKYVEKYS